ncbi:tyrosine-type recombinase/integrase [Variovorax sp. PAMC26660]|uniref:tyrosine-type recombinase/integrase n=1 Tax=Variovorax sp. PAMC26660 TaxID=2762322 RepID=UPI00164EBB51|nr:tyrosine-type recombinase/integrase [Variovorax sp. PAMC26660]QNK68454.1 tyrosine-type recombinase/integrase [Variovorax sp. PAMC26660]
MARPRQRESGKWEIGLRHPSLPGGRKYFSFDTEAEAISYGEQWKLMKLAGVAPPDELLKPASPANSKNLGFIVRQWANSGLAAPSQHSVLGSLIAEVGSVPLADVTYAWIAQYVQRLKVKNNLAPNSIRHRIQALGRSIDEHLRNNPEVVFVNPVRLLPKGYSTYSALDQKLTEAAGKKVKEDVSRDRRLFPGEQEKIVAALSGFQREDRERGLMLLGGNALLTMFLLIVYSGLRLREAYTLTRGQIDFDAKVIRVRSSKQWRGKVVFRDVPMRPEVHRALQSYLSTRRLLPAANLFPFMDEDEGLTLTTVTARLSSRYLIAFTYAGCEGLHEHDLRHEATCRWLELRDATGNWMFRLEEVNRIMGWSSNSTMAQRYASFRGADLAQRMWATSEAAPEARAVAT